MLAKLDASLSQANNLVEETSLDPTGNELVQAKNEVDILQHNIGIKAQPVQRKNTNELGNELLLKE